jgi:16S rRNA (adenine1518-N6/adenine1519-N6)-dimethyltransferase
MELLDVVDENDTCIGQATRNDVYIKKLPHRIIHILVFNKKGQLALQKRSFNVSFLPGYWSTTVGGHVLSLETYYQAAKRECMEELGIKINFKYMGKIEYNGSGFKKYLTIYKIHNFNNNFNINTSEVETVDFFSLAQIQSMIKNKEKIHPELLFILEQFYNLEIPKLKKT